MCDVKVGEKIVCVDDRGWSTIRGTKLTYRNIYTALDVITCEKCGKNWVDIGCRRKDTESFSECCSRSLVGASIDWVGAERFVPYIKNFKNFCRKDITDRIQKDVADLINKKEYEEAVTLIKRLENINNEL